MPQIKMERIAKLPDTLNIPLSSSKPLGLWALFLSSSEITTIMATRIKKHHPVRCKKGIGVLGINLNATAKGMDMAAATIAAVEVVRFQNMPRKNSAKAPGVK